MNKSHLFSLMYTGITVVSAPLATSYLYKQTNRSTKASTKSYNKSKQKHSLAHSGGYRYRFVMENPSDHFIEITQFERTGVGVGELNDLCLKT